ncbi:UNVERIFIED_CONTAM: hypothetical protein RMT77_005085 [Armadillidium vulgare]
MLEEIVLSHSTTVASPSLHKRCPAFARILCSCWKPQAFSLWCLLLSSHLCSVELFTIIYFPFVFNLSLFKTSVCAHLREVR